MLSVVHQTKPSILCFILFYFQPKPIRVLEKLRTLFWLQEQWRSGGIDSIAALHELELRAAKAADPRLLRVGGPSFRLESEFTISRVVKRRLPDVEIRDSVGSLLSSRNDAFNAELFIINKLRAGLAEQQNLRVLFIIVRAGGLDAGSSRVRSRDESLKKARERLF